MVNKEDQPHKVRVNTLILELGSNWAEGDAEDLVGTKFTTNAIKVQCRRSTPDCLPRANMAKGITRTSTSDRYRYRNTPSNYQLFSGADYNTTAAPWHFLLTPEGRCELHRIVIWELHRKKDESCVCLSSPLVEEKGHRDAIESTVCSWREDDSVRLLTALGSRWNSDPGGYI